MLTASRAAAGWQGWGTVTRILAGQPWLDREQQGAGRALLARASVERGAAEALAHAALSLRLPLPPREEGFRLVTLARALDRADQLDSAAVIYRRAAELLPEIGEWLRLRAAGVTGDSAGRAGLYATITLPVVAPRIRWTEALALERTGELLRAARLYDQLGARVGAIGLRLRAGPSDSARRSIRRDLAAQLGRPLGAIEARDAIAMMDRYFAPLTAAEELLVARRAAAAAQLERAARGYARGGRLGDPDRYTYGTVLARLGRHREAIRQFEAIRDPGRVAQARYQRARSLFRTGPADRALGALRTVRDSFPGSPVTSATAGWLLADWYVDQADDARARQEFALVARRFPSTSHGQRAAFQAALLAFVGGDVATAATEFDAIADRTPAGDEATAAAFWSGRAWARAGDTARARARWQQLVDHAPQSYYVVPAARALGIAPFRPVPDGAFSEPAAPDDPAWQRVALLDSAGLSLEARLELDRLVRAPQADPPGLLAYAGQLARHAQSARALRLAQQAVSEGAPADRGALQLLFPLPEPDVLAAESQEVGLPPLLIAGLIRQESAFDPRARSRADARGLMQVMPAVGAAAARRDGFPEWDPVLLYQPDVNLHIGIRHLSTRWERHDGNLAATLAAYNAGGTPVSRWLERGGADDPDVFIDRIPYVETRDYVRRVLYNWARYESIYGTN